MSTKNITLSKMEKEFSPLTFGRLLKSHRLGEEMTQVELAKKLKISKQGLNDLEHGRKIPSLRRTIKIARRIGLLEDLLIQLVLQDQLRKEKLNFTVNLSRRLQKAS
ncbi:helix-turn-helix transcriptional regulator [Pseudobdellovibrio exovorus]|uniref:HTH cro/C1-type domain-containing protein n=1 Tax=Pseudobdellovibrio exovorus JSS TaxID=1184267 RepID=M4V8H3_9BACT|nr:helix-turn-helix transcriptional regulator [Pseudobdellovibrio exovorus]AGH95697.1 hypothetical protein A11Q_1481 [Pseudobdellovibrio exovorus JSS]